MKEYREFVALWLETGLQWYEEDSDKVFGYRFGHDWNSDFAYKRHCDQFSVIPDQNIRDAIYGVVVMYILHVQKESDETKKLVSWINSESVEPNLFYGGDKFTFETAYALSKLFKAAK